MNSQPPPSYYPYVPLPDRGPLRFPDGAQLALIITINLEYWEPSRPGQKEPLFTGGPMTIPHALPGDVLDTANWTWREYGQRIGVWRMIEMFDKTAVKPSCTINGLTMTERRRVVDACNERGWELVPHNWAQNDLLTYYADNPRRGTRGDSAHARYLRKGRRPPGPGVAVVGDPRHLAHAGIFKRVRITRVLRLLERRSALFDSD